MSATSSRLVRKDNKPTTSGYMNKTFCVNGDDYTGEWFNNKKDGKGTYRWKESGNIYDGDWKNDLRDGFGTLSVLKEDGTYRKQYAGGWKEGKKQGFGTHFYDDVVVYEGEWACGKRHGWGRMVYPDCSIYEGEWSNDKMCGTGMIRYGNGHRYEGLFRDNRKHGRGKFYFTDKGQVYDGVWVDDLAKCGTMVDTDRDTVVKPTLYPLPTIGLANPAEVLVDAQKMLPLDNADENEHNMF